MRIWLGGCLYAIILEVLNSFPDYGFSVKFLHTFFMSWINFLIVGLKSLILRMLFVSVL